jgi:hypothetical protein
LVSIDALAAASGIPPRNIPSISVSDRLPKAVNFAPITRQPGMVSRMFPNTIAIPAPLAASVSILPVSCRLR